MKRLLVCMLVIALCLSASAFAEQTVYADQGGVRVYAENGRVGLMDSEGSVLCPAEYDMIRPFDGDYAIATKNGKKGVLRRDGGVALPCEWDSLWLNGDRGVAVGDRDNWFYRLNTGIDYQESDDPVDYTNWFHDTLIDLATGETLLEGRADIGMDENRIWQVFYGYYDVWGEMAPPFHTDVYDAEMNPLFSVDMALDQPLGNGLYQMITDHYGMYGYEKAVMDADGKILLEGAAYLQTFAEPDDGVFYHRDIENLLGRALEALGYGKNNVKWILHNLFGIELETAKAIARLTMDDWKICGIWRPDGSLMEIKADALRAPMFPDGLCPVKVGEAWGYLDEAGEIALPPAYEEAGPFIDGAAVVIEDGACRLIDARGAALSPAWKSPKHLYAWGTGPECCRMNVVAARMDDGVRLIDRQGRFVTDEVFDGEDFEPVGSSIMGAWNVYNEQTYLLRDADGRVCAFDGEGRELCRFDAESWEAGIIVDDGAALWAEVGGKWGVVNLTGADAGAWHVEPVYDYIHKEGPGLYSAWLPDYTNVMLDDWGNVLGPLHVEDEMVAIMKAADAATTTTPEGEQVYQADGSAEAESEISAFTDEPEA